MTDPTTEHNLLVDHAQQCMEDSLTWWGDQPELAQSIVHHTLALCGEVGELANMVKKIQRGSLNWDDPKVQMALKMELADIYTYFANICGLTATNMKAAYEIKREQNRQRFTRCTQCGYRRQQHPEGYKMDDGHEFTWPDDVEEEVAGDPPGTFIPVRVDKDN